LLCRLLASRSFQPLGALIGLLSDLHYLGVLKVFGLAAEPPPPAMLFHVRPPKIAPFQAAFALADARLPAPSPSGIPAASAAHELDDHKQYECADGGVDDRRNKPGAKVNAESGQHPAADERPDDANDEVTDNSKPRSLHDLPGKPSGYETDQ
jgi:hypothetical protein